MVETWYTQHLARCCGPHLGFNMMGLLCANLCSSVQSFIGLGAPLGTQNESPARLMAVVVVERVNGWIITGLARMVPAV